jgi:hypothetical protein
VKNSLLQIYETLISSGILGVIAGTVRALLNPEATFLKTMSVLVASILLAQLVGLITKDIEFVSSYRDAIIGASALVSKEVFEYLQRVMKDPYAYITNIKNKIKK